MDLPSNPPVSPAVRISVLLRLASEGFQDAFGARLSGPLTRASSPEPGVDPARVPVRIATAVGPGCATLDAGGVDSSMYRLGVALLLAAGLVLAGCGPGPAERARARADLGAPTRTLPPTLRSGTTLASSLPRLLRVADGYHQFEVSAAQYHLIGQRVG